MMLHSASFSFNLVLTDSNLMSLSTSKFLSQRLLHLPYTFRLKVCGSDTFDHPPSPALSAISVHVLWCVVTL
jgi:hypothetical protein